jgi:hypothetical protein
MTNLGLTEEELQEEYIGDRGSSFDSLILSLLKKGKLSRSKISQVYDKDLFSQIFTHPSISEQNYEYYEFLGDLVVNKSIGQYLSRRFPQLRCPQGVRVLTRLKINLVSKKVLAEFAESLGFCDFISATMEYRMTKKKPMLEDCFEAFMGAVEQQIDEKCASRDKKDRPTSGGGYRICYNIIQNILDTYPICGGLPDQNGIQQGRLVYSDLVDAKTRLKELFDFHRVDLGKVKYISERDGTLCHTHIISERYTKKDRTTGQHIQYGIKLNSMAALSQPYGSGTAALQADSHQAAAANALVYFKRKGYTRDPPAHYAMFCD